MKKVLILGACLAIVAAGLLPVFAQMSQHDVTDPNDTKGLLDVRRVHVNPNKPPRFSFVTFRRWTIPEIWDAGFGVIHFDSRGDKHYDFYALVRSDGQRLQGRLFRDRRKQSDYRVGVLKVTRRNERQMKVRVPLKDLKIPSRRTFYRWYAETLFSSTRCPDSCIDRVPNDGAVVEDLVKPTPSPTLPSPSVSVTP